MTLAKAGLYFLSCGAAWGLARRKVALFGAPLAFSGLPVAGMASMVAVVLLAEWSEIAGLAAMIAGSALLGHANRMLRRRGAYAASRGRPSANQRGDAVSVSAGSVATIAA